MTLGYKWQYWKMEDYRVLAAGGVHAGAHVYEVVCDLQLNTAAIHGELKTETLVFGWASEKTLVDRPKAKRRNEENHPSDIDCSELWLKCFKGFFFLLNYLEAACLCFLATGNRDVLSHLLCVRNIERTPERPTDLWSADSSSSTKQTSIPLFSMRSQETLMKPY